MENMRPELQKKVDRAIRLLKLIPTDKGVIELSYSGGKDSDVILELAKMAGIPFEAIYKNTTIDPPGTIKHCKDNGVTIINPKESFFQIIERKGPPTRRARFCCKELKEYKVHDHAIHGIRRCESTARAKRYREPQVCRVYSKDSRVSVYLPILDWTDQDVAEFIRERGIKCHPLYYKEGVFDVKKRLGCIGCPMASDGGRKDFKSYPKLFKAYVKHAVNYWNTHPNVGVHRKFNDMYEVIYSNLFCKSYAEYYSKMRTPQIFEEDRLSAKEYLERYFNVEL